MSDTTKNGFFSGLPEREKTKITLPSGRTVTVLETTGREEKILSRVQDRNKLMETIAAYLAGVTEDLDGDAGRVPPSKFEDMLVGDRYAILIHARLLTHGPIVNHKASCGDCKAQNEHEIDLQEILDTTKPYPAGDTRNFSVKLGDGVLHYDLPTGKSEERALKEKDSDINSKLRCLHLWEETSKGRVPVSLDSLKSRQISTLRQEVRKNECYIDTVAELTCPSCKKVSRLDIMAMADFLFPSLT